MQRVLLYLPRAALSFLQLQSRERRFGRKGEEVTHMETKTRFSASLAPHIFAKDTTAVLMLDVIAALMPTVAAGI